MIVKKTSSLNPGEWERKMHLERFFSLKWPSKVITRDCDCCPSWIAWESCVSFYQWEAKPKSIEACKCDFSYTLSKLQVISSNSDWFMTLSAPVVIGLNIVTLMLNIESHLKTAPRIKISEITEHNACMSLWNHFHGTKIILNVINLYVVRC